MNEVAATGTVEDLAHILAALPPEGAYLLLEEIPARWLSPQDQARALRFERYDTRQGDVAHTNGWLFSPSYELRWETVDGLFQVRYVGEGAAPTGLRVHALDLSHAEDLRCGLWGTPLAAAAPEPTFVELRIPRPLRYPVGRQACQAVLVVRQYRDPESDQFVLSRFAGVEDQTS